MNFKNDLTKVIWVGFIVVFFHGCGQPKPSINISRQEATRKFQKILLDDYQINAVIHDLEHTLWIYVPLKEPIFKMAAAKEEPSKSNKAQQSATLHYIDTVYQNKNFYIEYDIGSNTSYPQSPGYGINLTEEFTAKSQNIINSIKQSYFDIDQSKSPEFIVLVMADIENGIDIQYIYYFQDLKRAYSETQSLPPGEFVKRVITKYEGSQKIINNTQGSYLDIAEITMPDFLAKQISHRVKLQLSGQLGNTDEANNSPAVEILTKIIQDTVTGYEFSYFESADLFNLSDETRVAIPKSKILLSPADH